MKHIIKSLFAIFIVILTYSCSYDDFREDYDYSTVYFTNQLLKRSFVEDEINEIKIGVVLGGKRYNASDEWIKFSIDDTVGLSTTPYEILPESYYTLSNYEEMVIGEGKIMGEITMSIDPSFFQDPLAHEDHYVLPFKILDTSADSILFAKDSLILIISFESRLFGNYYHNGRVLVMDNGSVIDTIEYHQEEPVTESMNNWSLSTIASKTLKTRGIGQYAPSDLTGFWMEINDDNTLSLKEDTVLINIGFDWQFIDSGGENYYDPDKRMLYLNYSFIDVLSGNDCHATDTLIFRNRILDGVNQWEL